MEREHYHGHRERVRQRFLQQGLDGFQDYEALVLLLLFVSRRQGLPQWPYVQRDLLAAQRFELKERLPPKKTFSFTNHVKVYETCPRQYELFREYQFAPSRSAEIFFGALVHQTIEDVHRWALEGQALRLIEQAIPGMFEANFRSLINAGYRPINATQHQVAFEQVTNYFGQNQDRMRRVVETEVDVTRAAAEG